MKNSDGKTEAPSIDITEGDEGWARLFVSDLYHIERMAELWGTADSLAKMRVLFEEWHTTQVAAAKEAKANGEVKKQARGSSYNSRQAAALEESARQAAPVEGNAVVEECAASAEG